MRFLLALFFCISLYACNSTTNNITAPDDDETVSAENASDEAGEETAAQTGKLYIQSSIFNGLKVYWLWLGDDGTFVAEPRFATNPINYPAEKAANPAGTGTYIKTANAISVTYNSGKKENWPLEYQGGRLNTIDGYFVTEPAKMPANYKLNGKYSAYTGSAAQLIIRTFNFKEDGTFVSGDETFVNNGVASGNSSASSTGTYNVYGNTLKLTFADGEVSRQNIGVYKSGAETWLVINSKLYK